MGALKREHKELQKKFKTTEKAKSEITSKHKLLQHQINEINGKYTSMQNKHSALKQRYNASEQQQNNLRLENNKIQQRFKNMEIEYHKIKKEFDEIKQKHDVLLDKFGYIDWTSQNIADWIVSIDRVQYYKYYNVLLNNLTKECIDGQCLYELDKNDLYRLGIVSFKDKNNIFMAIRQLIANGKNKNDNQRIEEVQNQKECVICYDNKRTHCCVPCGHICLCDECEGADGKCPICQTKYYSLQRIYF